MVKSGRFRDTDKISFYSHYAETEQGYDGALGGSRQRFILLSPFEGKLFSVELVADDDGVACCDVFDGVEPKGCEAWV